MVGSRVLTDDHNHIGLTEVRQTNRTLSDTNRASEGLPAGLVAHVRAIGEVVCTETTNHELVQEGSFVARPARGVKHGTIWIVKTVEPLANHVQSIVP